MSLISTACLWCGSIICANITSWSLCADAADVDEDDEPASEPVLLVEQLRG